MAHHQGMTIVALANVLLGAPMRAGSAPSRSSRRRSCFSRSARRVTVAVARTPSEDARADLHVRGRGAAGPAAVSLAARSDAAHAPAVQRTLFGHGDRRRLGLQPLERPRRDPLARGHDPRPVGDLRLSRRRRVGPGLVGGIPAGRRRARRLRGRLLRRPRRDPPAATGRSRRVCGSSSRRKTTPRFARCR